MPNLAKAYIAIVAAVAAAALAAAVSQWNPANLRHFILFFALAMIASGMKVRLPGVFTEADLVTMLRVDSGTTTSFSIESSDDFLR